MRVHGRQVCFWVLVLLWVLIGFRPALGQEASVQLPVEGYRGLDVSSYTDVNALGFFSHGEIQGWGRLHSDETERSLLARGDTVFVALDEPHRAKKGDFFLVCRFQPLGGTFWEKKVGNVATFLGRVQILGEVSRGLYRGSIMDSYKDMRVGDPVLPFVATSSCVLPTDPNMQRLGQDLRIAAVKDLYQFTGQFSVVYINQGLKSGIGRGNILEIIEKNVAQDKNQTPLPDLSLGYLVILNALPDTATGVVLQAKREFGVGATLQCVHLTQMLEEVMSRNRIDPSIVPYGRGRFLESLAWLTRRSDPRPRLPPILELLHGLPSCTLP